MDQIIPGTMVQEQWQVPESSQGAGLVDTTRGALGHWLKIDNKKLSFYQIITPSAWDFSASTSVSKGTAGQALLSRNAQYGTATTQSTALADGRGAWCEAVRY